MGYLLTIFCTNANLSKLLRVLSDHARLTLIICSLIFVYANGVAKADNPKSYPKHRSFGYDRADIHLPKNPKASSAGGNYYYNSKCNVRPLYFQDSSESENEYLCKCIEPHRPQHRQNLYKSTVLEQNSLLENCKEELTRITNERDFSTYIFLNEKEVLRGSDVVMLLDINQGYKDTFNSLATKLKGHLKDERAKFHYVGLRFSIYSRSSSPLQQGQVIEKILDFTDDIDTVSKVLQDIANKDEDPKERQIAKATGTELKELIDFLSPKPISYTGDIMATHMDLKKRYEEGQVYDKIKWRIGARRMLLMTNPEKSGYLEKYHSMISERIKLFFSLIDKSIIDSKEYKTHGSCDNFLKNIAVDEEYSESRYNKISDIISELGDIIIKERVTIINILNTNPWEDSGDQCTEFHTKSPTFPKMMEKTYPVTQVEFLFSATSVTLGKPVLQDGKVTFKKNKKNVIDLMQFVTHIHLGWAVFGGILQHYLYNKGDIIMTSIPSVHFKELPYEYMENALYYDIGPLQHHFTDGTRVAANTERYKEEFRFLYQKDIKKKFVGYCDALGVDVDKDSMVYQIRDFRLRYAPYPYYHPDKFKTIAFPKSWPSYKYRNYYETIGESEKLLRSNFGHNLLDNMDYHLLRPSKRKLESLDLDTGSCSVFNISSLMSDSITINDTYLTSNFHYNEPPSLKHMYSYVPHRRGLFEHKKESYAPFSRFLDQMPSHYGRLAPVKPITPDEIKSIMGVKKHKLVNFDEITDPFKLGEGLLHLIDYPNSVYMTNNDMTELISYFSMRAHHLLNLPEKFYEVKSKFPPYSVLLEYLKTGNIIYFEPLIVIPYSRMRKNRSIFRPRQKGSCSYFSVEISAKYLGTVTGHNALPDVQFYHKFNPNACYPGTNEPLNDFHFHIDHDLPLSYYWKKDPSSLRVFNVDNVLDFRFNNLPNTGSLYYNYASLNHNRGNIQIFPNTQYDYHYKDVLFPVEFLHNNTLKAQKAPEEKPLEHARRFFMFHGNSFSKLKTLVMDASNAGIDKHLLDYTPLLGYDNKRYVPVPSKLDYNMFVKNLLDSREYKLMSKVEKEISEKKYGNETSAEEPENEISAEEPENEISAEEPENEISAEELENETNAQEPENDIVAEEPENEPNVVKPENETNAEKSGNYDSKVKQ